MNRQQALVIDYLREENRVLKEQLGGSNLRLTDNQRRRLAAKGKGLATTDLALTVIDRHWWGEVSFRIL